MALDYVHVGEGGRDMNDQTYRETASVNKQTRSAEVRCRCVYLIEADPIERHSLAVLLEKANYTVRSFTSGAALLSAVDATSRGVLILDLFLIDMSGLALQDELKTCGIPLKPMFVSMSGTIETSVLAMKAGAIDFIEKPFTSEQLLSGVESALAAAIEDEINRRQRHALEQRYGRLTNREREIMNFVIRGDTSRELAQRLGLSSRTVEIHRAKIMRKLEANSVADLVRMMYTTRNYQPEEMLFDISYSPPATNDRAG